MKSKDTDIDDLKDIIKILIDMLLNNNISKEEIILKLREYHYCFDCMNHYRCCICDDKSDESDEENESYTSSIYSDDSDNSDNN